MNKGFTLIELLGVIVILGIIGMITVPIVSNLITNSMDKANNQQVKSIETAARNYVNSNLFTDINEVTVKTLKKQGYLENTTIKNPSTDESYDCSKVLITHENNKYEYKFKYIKC